ncbi:hypothetical protein ACWEO1_06355 [Kitasatospora cineracea]
MSSTIESPATGARPEGIGSPVPVDLAKHHDQADDAVGEQADTSAADGQAAAEGQGAEAEAAPVANAVAKAKAKAAGVFGEGGPVRAHLARAGQNTKGWLATADVTDEHLVEELLRQQALTRQTRESDLRRQIAQVSSQIITAKRAETADVTSNDPHRDGEQVALLKGRRELLQTQLAEHQALEAQAPTEGQVGRARWARKAGRAAMLVGSVLAGGIYLPLQDPMWLLASLPAAAVALWRAGALGEEQEPEAKPAAMATGGIPEQQTGQAPPVEGPAFAAAITAARLAAAEASTPGSLAAQQVAAAAEQAAQVQGAGDLLDALVRAGIITKQGAEETRIVGVIRPDGPGWTATVELPGGIPAEDAIGKASGLASALKVKSSQLQMAKDTSEEGHEGRFVIWCANVANPYAGAPVPSELIGAQSWDFWARGIPLGTNARGVRRVLNMLWNSLLIGGLMGYGKSYLARLVVAAAVLDPYVDIVVLCGKAGADWAALKIVARHYVIGNTASTIREMHEVMEDVIEEMSAHGQALERLFETDPAACPEGKITPQLARQSDLHLTLLVVDELQEILDAAAGMKLVSADEAEAAESSERKAAGQNGKNVMVSLFARFMRVARFVGGMAVIVTQRPDSNSVPTELREVASKRACFRVKGQNSSRMVLGDDAVSAGAAPHLLLDPHKGVSVIDEGGEEGHDTVKADVIDLNEFRAICERGRDLRIDAGTLTGYAARAAGTREADTARRDLLTAVADAMEAMGVDGARLDELADAMAAAAPGRWGDLTADRLGEQLRALGAGGTVKLPRREDGSRPNGYRLEAIEALLKSGPRAA